MILLISNSTHPGIEAVSQAYKRALEFHGIQFEYLGFRQEPISSIDEINTFIQWKINQRKYTHVLIIQPSHLTGNTIAKCLAYKKQNTTKFISINTDDPYSTSAVLQVSPLFDIKFSNEKLVAEKYAQMGFRYLPLAFDNLQPFNKRKDKQFNLATILTFYTNRSNYLNVLRKFQGSYLSGNLAPMIKRHEQIDTTGFNNIGIVQKYREFELYSTSKYTLNPHRKPSETGRSWFTGIYDGLSCFIVSESSVSPNIRYFDAIGCGSIPLCEPERTECFEIAKKYDFNEQLMVLPEPDRLESMVNLYDDKIAESINKLSEQFFWNESFVNRAKTVLDAING